MPEFPCHVCRTNLQAEESQTGQLVRCPVCRTTLRVPQVAARAEAEIPVAATAGAAPNPSYAPPPPRPPQIQTRVNLPPGLGRVGPGKRYGFNCPYCSSRLEANESMAAQEGQCPTCGNNIVIPILDRYGRLIDPVTKQIIKQDPHPVHAYAAAGERAPRIVRQSSGGQSIQCPRCSSFSPVSANNCKSCGMPFTMEGTTLEAAGASNGFCVASLVLGIIGIPTACTIIAPLLAVIFGIIGYNQVSASGVENSGKGMAIAGIICGSIGGLLGVLWYMR
jgi:DNA-directed RNA polymerase subunit RPC12/RpoP